MKIGILLLLLSIWLPAQAEAEFTLYLVRHAEKQNTKDNPDLTQCGKVRAQQLSQILKETDLKAVYSTTYKRTMSTAYPTSKSFQVPIKNYAPNKLEQLARELKNKKKSALIVGHSNTTPELASLLTDKKISAMSEKQYQRLYQIQFINQDVILTQLTQPLRCK